MFSIGCHLSAAKGYINMINSALSIGANTFQFFTRNPRGGNAREVSDEEISEFLKIMRENSFGRIVAHAPYTLNACSAKVDVRKLALEIMEGDLVRMERIPSNLYNFHPGSHVGQGVDIGIEQISDLLNKTLKNEQSTIVLLETMSGKGSEVGSSFQELKLIIDNVRLKSKIGVCMDLCHVHDAGYDIINNLDGVLQEFDDVIGIDSLKSIHVNDSKNQIRSHKDRHEKLGEGYIGIDTISNVINHPKLQGLPFILETPNELQGYRNEIALLKSLKK